MPDTTLGEVHVDTGRFDLPVAVTLRVQSRSGKIELVAEPREDVLVEGDGFDAGAADNGTTFEIRAGRGGSRPVLVRCPAGTDVVIGTQSGNVRLEGDFGIVSVTTMSGGIDVGSADEADLRSGSGSIALKVCRDRCRMNSMSGSIVAGELGAAAAGTMSGSIRLDRVDGRLKARSVSGSIQAMCSGHGAIAVKTVSGKVHLALPSGTGLSTRFKTLSGKVRNPFPPGDDCYIEAMSVSGVIELVPA
jgi:DUF4097 and DUF4098 domain-containing protein YvlB